MPVMSPPPLVPAQAPAEVVTRSPARFGLTFGEGDAAVHLQLLGEPVLERAVAEAAIAGSRTLSEALYALAQAATDAGWPLAQLTYARVGDTVYVDISRHGFGLVRGPERLTDFFVDLDDQPLPAARFERRRILASAYADQLNWTAQPKFVPAAELQPGADGYGLRVDPDQDAEQGLLDLGFGNPGNRYVGRYFATAQLHHAFESGDELRGGVNYGITGLSERNQVDSVAEQNLSWTRVAPYGVLSLNARNLHYKQHEDVVDGAALTLPIALPIPISIPLPLPAQTQRLEFDGQLQRYELAFTTPVAAAVGSRWLVGAQADYTRRRFEETRSDTTLLDQDYASLQVSSGVSVAAPVAAEHPLQLVTSVVLRRGLGDDDRARATTVADLGFTLVRPTLTLQWDNELLRLSGTVTGQISDDVLPEQEQWVLGGLDRVQAWLPGVAVGDRGLVARLQAERSAWQVGALRLRPAVFAEYGVAAFSEPSFSGAGATSLADVGAGLRASWLFVTADVSVAAPLHDHGVDDDVLDDARSLVQFSVVAKF